MIKGLGNLNFGLCTEQLDKVDQKNCHYISSVHSSSDYTDFNRNILTSWVTGASTFKTLHRFFTVSRMSESSSQQRMSLQASV